MAKREKYDVAISCDHCGNEGRMWAEENENPVESGGLARSIEKVSPGFSVKDGIVVCTKCNKVL